MSGPAPSSGLLGFGWRLIAVAAAAFLVLDYLDDVIALPLREASSVVAGWLLDLVGFSVIREGTILQTPRFRFEVVAACSGSSSLRVLIALGIMWCGSHPGLRSWRLGLGLAIVTPIAVVMNGVRVATLVAIGDAQGVPVEGLAHTVIGLATFAAALGAFMLGSEALSRAPTAQPTHASGPWARRAAALVLLGLLFAPGLLWTLTAWQASPLDHKGWAFWLLGGGLAWWSWQRLPAAVPATRAGGVAFVLTVLLVVAGLTLDLHVVQMLGGVTVLSAIWLTQRGWMGWSRLLPAQCVMALGMPTVGYQVTHLAGPDGPTASLLLRGGLALGLIGLAWWWQRRQPATGAAPAATPFWTMPRLAVLLVAVALQAALVNRSDGSLSGRISTSYLLGDWLGREIPLSEATISVVGRGAFSRAYQHERLGRVDLLVTATGGDRHRAHPPEYCLTGGGWQVTARREAVLTVARQPVPASRLALLRDGEILDFVYWFSDGETICPSYAALLRVDTLRRLAGRRTNWFLIRVYAPTANAVDDFLAELQFTLTP